MRQSWAGLTVESIVEQNQHVETIQVVLDGELLRRVDRAARRFKLNRSALIREALRQHLKQLQARSREEADRRGYQRDPEDAGALAAWDGAASWPDD
jgi:predicted transcriptional regulator